MIDFTQLDRIKDIKIGGQEAMMVFAKTTHFVNLGVRSDFKYLIWKKKPEYPYLTIERAYWQPHKTMPRYVWPRYGTGLTDKNKLIAPHWYPATGSSKARYGYYGDSYAPQPEYYLYNSIEAEKIKTSDDYHLYDGNPCYPSHIYFDDMFMALGVKNEIEYTSFTGIGDNIPNDIQSWTVSDAEWSLSDEKTGEIHLYAMPEFVYTAASKNYLPAWSVIERSIATNADNDSSAAVDGRNDMFALHSGAHSNELGYWPTPYYEPMTYETSVTVKAGAPLVTLSTKTGGTTKITAIRDNFDEYKTKYEAATGGQFSKSQYPYLRGVIKLDCKSKSLGIDGTYGVYIAFSVKR